MTNNYILTVLKRFETLNCDPQNCFKVTAMVNLNQYKANLLSPYALKILPLVFFGSFFLRRSYHSVFLGSILSRFCSKKSSKVLAACAPLQLSPHYVHIIFFFGFWAFGPLRKKKSNFALLNLFCLNFNQWALFVAD